jgi:hypothetical protein
VAKEGAQKQFLYGLSRTLYSRVHSQAVNPSEDCSPTQMESGKMESKDMKDNGSDHYNLILVNDAKNLQIRCDWQGCAHIENYCNGDTVDTESDENRDYIHVCELEDFIAQLQEALAGAKEKFGQNWNK